MASDQHSKITRVDAWKRLLPLPKKVELSGNSIQIGPDWSITGDGADPGQRSRWLQAYPLSSETRERAVHLVVTAMEAERYEIDISESGIILRAAGGRGFDYAFQTLWQLSPNGAFRTGRIVDYPALPMRGFHVDFWSLHQMGLREAEDLLRYAAELKINTLLLEYGPRFPYSAHPAIATPRTLSREEVKHLVDTAGRLQLETIPLQQCLGHVDHILNHEAYAGLREENHHRDQFCPLHPGAFALFKELAEEMISAHPGSRYFHIGGDEARRLGACPRCRDKVERAGVARLYVDYINMVGAWIKEQGLTPIVWDDMLCRHGAAMEDLDRDIVIHYWEYWTTGRNSPFFTARPAGLGNVYDERWDSEWKDELSDLERFVMSRFARAVPLEQSIPEPLSRQLSRYLGPAFPKWIRGLPYYEYYRDLGFRVIGGPTALGNGDDYHSLPNVWRFIPNIRTHSQRCLEAGGEGMITTAWYNYAPLVFHLGLAATAQFAWTPCVNLHTPVKPGGN